MKIHKEGFKVIPYVFLILVVINLALFLMIGYTQVSVAVAFFSLLFLLFNFRFFRDPETVKVAADGQVLSVADGKVVVIEPTMENEYFSDERIQVSVFMSVFNVHINHIPIAGEIVYQKHHSGKFLPAHLAKSSGENERCTSVIKTADGTEVLVRQVAGILARRIVTYRKAGDKVTVSDQLGFIRYGSRIDMFFPKSANIAVKNGQIVKGGITIIATI
jgi:phosphatidylserine decarboxylase